jgi:hypothetical protein
MVERALRLFFRSLAVLCALAGIAILFFASFEQLASNKGLRNRGGGDFFVGLAALVGEPLARGLIGGTFFFLAWLLWRTQRPKHEPRPRHRKP